MYCQRWSCVIAVVATLAGTETGIACSCAPRRDAEPDANTVAEVYCSADVVFIGKALEVGAIGDPSYRLNTLRPLEILRGKVSSPTKTVSGFPHGPCSYPFDPPYQYLVFAHYTDKRRDMWESSVCGLTGRLNHRARIVEQVRALARADIDPCSDEQKEKRKRDRRDAEQQTFMRLMEESRVLMKRSLDSQ